MYFRALLLGGWIALAGCQSNPLIKQTSADSARQQFEMVAQLQATKVRLPSTTKVSITPGTQYLKNDLISSPVAMFEIPADRGQLSLTITSEIKDSVFYPHVMVTDKQGQVIESFDSASFEYRKPRLNKGNRLVSEIDFFPPQGYSTLYLIVYTKPSDLQASTYVAHPGRIDAEARGNYMPELKDIPIPHHLTGTIELDVAGPSWLSFNRSPSKTSVSTKAATVQTDTKNYYHSAIQQAVAANDIPKALGLLDEAKALGIDSAQAVFVKAVNSRTNQ